MSKYALIESTAVIAAVATCAGVAAGTVALARGDMAGAPGVSKALSRLGRAVGGGMMTGVAVAAGAAGLVALAVYEGMRQIEL